MAPSSADPPAVGADDGEGGRSSPPPSVSVNRIGDACVPDLARAGLEILTRQEEEKVPWTRANYAFSRPPN